MNNNAVMEASPEAIKVEDEEECIEVSAAAADKDCKGNWVKCDLLFTAMVCKANIKAS